MPSKKQSAAKPPDETVFFIDRSLGIEPIARRVQSTVEKYVLKNEPEPDSSVLHSFIDSLHADDLCLVLACEEGDQSAWNDLLEGYRATVRSASRTASSNDETAEDLAQSIWAELHGLKSREDGRPAGKLSYYSGAGSLGGWLRAVTGQLAIDRHRREARLIHTEEDGDFDRLARDGAVGVSRSRAITAYQPASVSGASTPPSPCVVFTEPSRRIRDRLVTFRELRFLRLKDINDDVHG